MEQACRVLEVSRSGYYGWKAEKICRRRLQNQALRRRLIELHEKYPAMGLDSLYRLLKPEFGCSRKRVHRPRIQNGSDQRWSGSVYLSGDRKLCKA